MRYGVVEGGGASVACSLHRELKKVERSMRFGCWKNEAGFVGENWSSQTTIGGMW